MTVDVDHAKRVFKLARETRSDWWTDDRRNWCAYCGIKMRLKTTLGLPVPPTKFTRDHVVPRKTNTVSLTIPACRACNSAKGTLSLQEFMLTDHFVNKRKHRHRNQWSTEQLRRVAAVAVLKRMLPLLETSNRPSEAPVRTGATDARPVADSSLVPNNSKSGLRALAEEGPSHAR
jgi:hypothetical protein